MISYSQYWNTLFLVLDICYNLLLKQYYTYQYLFQWMQIFPQLAQQILFKISNSLLSQTLRCFGVIFISNILNNIIMITQCPPNLSHTQLLFYYYRYIFPNNLFAQWLTHHKQLRFRQFSFTYLINEEEIYNRYVILKSAENIKEKLTQVGREVPVKIDIGGSYYHEPVKGAVNKAEFKQLVFDIDINDYDNVRNCCEEAKKICIKCWNFLKIALLILTEALIDDYDFTNIMFVYSGRRGVHMWICDHGAIFLTNEQRRCLIQNLKLVKQDKKQKRILDNLCYQQLLSFNKSLRGKKSFNSEQKIQQLKNQFIQNYIPHNIRRPINIIKKYFYQLAVVQMDILQSDKVIKLILEILEHQNKQLAKIVQYDFNSLSSSPDKWNKLKTHIFQYQQKYSSITILQEEIIMLIMYPRLDEDVSVLKEHLLKSPFTVHPSTKQFSVPFSFQQIMQFNPFEVCRLQKVYRQIVDWYNTNKCSKVNEENIQYTSLYPFYVVFEEMVRRLSLDKKQMMRGRRQGNDDLQF